MHHFIWGEWVQRARLWLCSKPTWVDLVSILGLYLAAIIAVFSFWPLSGS
jgi:hypothetical protein